MNLFEIVLGIVLWLAFGWYIVWLCGSNARAQREIAEHITKESWYADPGRPRIASLDSVDPRRLHAAHVRSLARRAEAENESHRLSRWPVAMAGPDRDSDYGRTVTLTFPKDVA